MAVQKVECRVCGVSLLKLVADRHGGRCAYCATTNTEPIPDGYRIDEGLAEQLRSIGKDPNDRHYVEAGWRHGEEFLRLTVESEVRLARRRAEWRPKLLAYVANCRRERPAARADQLSPADRWVRKLCWEHYDRQRPKVDNGLFYLLSTPFAAIPPMAGANDGTAYGERDILLTHEEHARWLQMAAPLEEGDDEWYAGYHFLVVTEPPWADGFEEPVDLSAVPEGESPWVVRYGLLLGALCGSGGTDLWSWNGERAELVENQSFWVA